MNNDLISREALRKNMEFVCMGIMAGTEPYNAPLTEIDNAPTVSIKSCRECPFVTDEEKQITNSDTWESYCVGQEVGFKKAEYVFERMKLIQETVNTILNYCSGNTDIDKAFRNAARLVQNAIDGKAVDFEEIERSEEE